MIAYVDTSATMKLVVDEVESDPLLTELTTTSRTLVSSWLLHAEMHCASGRNQSIIDVSAVNAVLATVNLVDLTRGDLLAAGTQRPLRTNDAIHLAVALRLGVDQMITYDRELANAATASGLHVVAPT